MEEIIKTMAEEISKLREIIDADVGRYKKEYLEK